jgi:ClpP class serine protease
MPSWNELVEEIQKIADPKQGNVWLVTKQKEWLEKLSVKRGGRNVLFYASGFLQKPQAAPIFLQIAPEDINGFMAGLHGMDCSNGLTIILHTPGGITNATETIVEYLKKAPA